MATKLAIVYPWGSDFVFTKSVHSMLKLKHPEDCEIEWGRGTGWCSAARHNHCFRQALNWGADLILMLGADQVYHDRDMLCKMMKHYRDGHECVTALVPMRGYLASLKAPPFHLVGWRVKQDANGNSSFHDKLTIDDVELVGRDKGPLVRVQSVGSGVIMFPADVLRKMATPWCAEIPTQPDFDRGTTADMGFISKLQSEAGLEIMCDTTIKVTHLHAFEIDDTFSERFKDWMEPGTGDSSLCDYRPPKDENAITQARVSPAIPHYGNSFLKQHGLNEYSNQNDPAFFFGCYTSHDLKAIQEHNSAAVVIWAGTDALNIRKALEGTGEIPFGHNVKHIAISKFIADDLDALGIKYVRLPLRGSDKVLVPTMHGKKVYAYCPDHDREKYGGALLDQVMAAMPDVEFHVQRTLDPKADMQAIYSDCFIGLRLLEHDGLSNTVVELGLMGRRCVWNGDSPNSIQYSDVDSIVAAIRHEKMLEGREINIVVQQIKEYLDVGNAWKSVAFYEAQAFKTMTEEIAKLPYNYGDYFNFRYGQGELGAGGPVPDGPEAEWTRNKILALLNEHKAYTVTEIGCGSLARWKNPPRTGYIGIDVSPTAIAYARAKFNDHPDAKFMVKDVTRDSIPAADAVLCIDVLQHIKPQDVEGVLQKMIAAARKVLIVKTSVGIPELHYQFNHDWEKLAVGEHITLEVPGVPVSRVFVFAKENVCQPQA